MAYISIGEDKLFIYYAGQAQSILEILLEKYQYDETQYDEHIANMWEIIEEKF